MTPLKDLAEDAGYAVSDLMDEDSWDAFDALPDVEKVQWRYCHSDCDDFALTLHEITGYPVVAINSPRRGPMHRLVEAPDGRLLDARGWITLDDLMARYQLKALTVERAATGESLLHTGTIDDDAGFHPILAAMLQLPVAPFNTPEFIAQAAAFSAKVGFAVEAT